MLVCCENIKIEFHNEFNVKHCIIHLSELILKVERQF